LIILVIKLSVVILGIRRVLSNKLVKIEDNVSKENDDKNSCTDKTLLGGDRVVLGNWNE
jgi:hypothetical protein